MKLVEKIKSIFDEAVPGRDVKNPVIPVLQKYISNPQLEIIAAKVGFALKIVYADNVVTEEEIEALHELLKKYTGKTGADISAMARDLLNIENLDLEMLHFSSAMNEQLDEEGRQEFLFDLFRLAHADDEYALVEESDIRLISKYLLLNHQAFIEARNRYQAEN